MAFESLTDKLNQVFRNLSGKGRLTEGDVKSAMREVKMALLEADVNFKVVKQFVSTVQERAIGADVMNGLNPAQMVIKIVNEEMTSLMGSDMTEIPLKPGREATVIMMAGLQGAGKTTTAAKLAGKFKSRGRKPLLVALDVYRPAAIKQLQVNGEKQGVDVFAKEDGTRPAQIAKEAMAHARENGETVVILDTAGRLQIDESMMQELSDIKDAVTVHETVLVVDAMTGQEAVNVAKTFDEKVGVDKAQEALDKEDEEKNRDMVGRVRKGKFDFNDYLESMKQMRKMGGMSSILSMLPGLGMSRDMLDDAIDEKQLKQTEAIILSMTPQERANPKILTPQRKFRIAKGSGCDVATVNRFIKQFTQMQKMMKQMGGMGGRRRGRNNPFSGMLGGMGSRRGGFPF